MRTRCLGDGWRPGGREEWRRAELGTDVTLHDEPISPELVLVSPELAAVARAALPDRPWEQFLPPPALVRPPAVVVPLRVSLPTEARDQATTHRPTTHRPTMKRRRPRVPIGLVLLLAFAGLVVAGSVLPARDEPTLGPLPARASRVATAPSAPAEQRIPPDTPLVPRRDLNPPRPQPAARVEAPKPSGGYIFRGGHLRVDARTHTILALHTSIRCAGQVTLRGIAIASDGSFSARRTVRGRVRLRVRIEGAFARAGTKVRGTIVATGKGCGSRTRFSGRLS